MNAPYFLAISRSDGYAYERYESLSEALAAMKRKFIQEPRNHDVEIKFDIDSDEPLIYWRRPMAERSRWIKKSGPWNQAGPSDVTEIGAERPGPDWESQDVNVPMTNEEIPSGQARTVNPNINGLTVHSLQQLREFTARARAAGNEMKIEQAVLDAELERITT